MQVNQLHSPTNTGPPSASNSESEKRAPPQYTLYAARTIHDIWREWEEGIAGGPALKDLEEQWGHRWRPTAAQKIAWCRRMVLYTELQRLRASGRSADEAVAELEALRAGRSLRKLQDQLRSQQKHQQSGGT